jgi:hypothetical protein
MTGEELRQKRSLEQECERLKRLLAESMMDNAVLKEAVQRLERLGKVTPAVRSELVGDMGAATGFS